MKPKARLFLGAQLDSYYYLVIEDIYKIKQ